jgi:hypothetical protein
MFSSLHLLIVFNAAVQVQFCVERAIELTLNQLSDTGDDDMQLRDSLRDMIEVLVDDQVFGFHNTHGHPFVLLHSC